MHGFLACPDNPIFFSAGALVGGFGSWSISGLPPRCPKPLLQEFSICYGVFTGCQSLLCCGAGVNILRYACLAHTFHTASRAG